MPATSFRVELDTFTPALQQMAENLPYEIEEALEELLQVAEQFAKEIVPVDTGFLRDSIKHETHGPWEGELRADAYYSIFVEEGTSKMEAQPFLRPAMENLVMDLPKRLLEVYYSAIGGH
jgi:HK97 gp10 family phage protein